jgi:hypothetical protein
VSAIAALRRFARPARDGGPVCDLCGAPVASTHAHLLDPHEQVACACTACATAMSANGAGRFRPVPAVTRALALRLDEADWSALGVPVAIAWFRRASRTGTIVATYPGPAGRVEALVPEAAWRALAARAPELSKLAPDVEALLAHDRRTWVVSIDRCAALAGAMRGSGRDPVAAAASFFAELEASCRS